MRSMTVKALKELIKDLPDNTVLYKEGSDHSYIVVRGEVNDAERARDGFVSEYFDDANMEKGSTKIQILVFR